MNDKRPTPLMASSVFGRALLRWTVIPEPTQHRAAVSRATLVLYIPQRKQRASTFLIAPTLCGEIEQRISSAPRRDGLSSPVSYHLRRFRPALRATRLAASTCLFVKGTIL
ncbi:hypothetical protein IF2G_00211 [Cordyceps javanica]|nr:hypothetical protein IF2G_00211 [Cordyceps javanica]